MGKITTPAERAEVIRLFLEEKLHPSQISKRLNRSRATINRILRRKGLHRGHPKGEQHYCAKLTEDNVREIRRRKDESLNDLAAEFGVTRVAIRNVIMKETWRHI